jgi:tetratricopeptide (TPR) repeat protein
LTILLALCAAPSAAEETWVDYFAELHQLETMEPGTRGFVELGKHLLSVADKRETEGLKRKDSLEKCRARVVRYHVKRLSGLPEKLATEPESEPVWVPYEAWFAARALTPGPYRVQAAIAALDEAGRADPERIAWAEQISREERGWGRLELSERAATAVFARAPGADTALHLAHILALRGVGDEARSVLSHALAAELGDDAHMSLYLARARVSFGLSDERRALSDWGAALSLGSDDAALDLALHALQEGDRVRAGFLARTVLDEAPRREDALAVWGRALLQGPHEGEEALPGPAGKVP